ALCPTMRMRGKRGQRAASGGRDRARRQCNHEARAAPTRRRLGPAPSTMLLGDIAHDRQSDSTSSLRRGGGAAGEGTPDLLALPRRNTRTFVSNREQDLAVTLLERDAHRLIGGPVLHGVVEQVEQDVPERVGAQRQRPP